MAAFENLAENALNKSAGYLMRQQAMAQLAELGDPRAVPCFVEALRESDSSLRQEAARCLGGFDVPDAIEALCRALGNELGVRVWSF